MTSGIIDESAIAEALRLAEPGEGIKRLLSLQGLGLWHGDLAEMRGDSPRRPATKRASSLSDASKEANRMAMVLLIKTALKQLTSEEREALRLHYDEGLPLEEIAEKLHLKTKFATALIDRALKHLSKVYVKVGGYVEP